MPDFRDYAVEVQAPATTIGEATRVTGDFLRDITKRNEEFRNFRMFGPDEWASQRLSAVFDVTDRTWMAETLPGGRPPRARRARDGDAERAHLPGLARGVPAHRPAWALHHVRGVRARGRLDVQPAREMAEGDARGDPLAAADRVVHLPAVLARVAAGPQRVLAPGPGLPRPRDQQEVGGDPRLPPARHEHAPLRHGPLPAKQELRQCRRGRQAARAPVPGHGLGDQALHGRDRDLGVGVERPRRRAGRRHGLLRRHPDARDARGSRNPARATSRTSRFE